jgi:hypothetical protein
VTSTVSYEKQDPSVDLTTYEVVTIGDAVGLAIVVLDNPVEGDHKYGRPTDDEVVVRTTDCPLQILVSERVRKVSEGDIVVFMMESHPTIPPLKVSL